MLRCLANADLSGSNERFRRGSGGWHFEFLESSKAQALAVTLHELATNAAKYGAQPESESRVEVSWLHASDGRLTLRWTERDGPKTTVRPRKGFGTRVLQPTTPDPGAPLPEPQ